MATKMSDSQERLRHGRVFQHAYVRNKKVRLSQLTIRETPFAGEGSSSRVSGIVLQDSHVSWFPREFPRRPLKTFITSSISRPCG